MKLAFVTLLMTLSAGVFAHGMNKPGPNGGYVRMPGAYHVELVSSGAETKVYLLDINFKKIDMAKSQVSMSLKGAKDFPVKCTKEAEFFRCDIKDNELKMYKELTITSSKAGEAGVASTYKIPLSFE
ncbi:hypothetical protein C0V70_02080 [Bacteriovorax stolpii]|uniref:Uncharacterized protein n=1 Tax=Bacteriovorax stolpii TaxID=960 RepID=A0A2K9NN43_BACTC|nr:hypothetical protein [Bacteriovorax stolpii]AUN96912.1 hypothetical protein C0V70_02080 [Bacteriovorax stolpii]TDP53192.1 hypothetical protein C8D79_1834 [Bacteriovorax stolpii]